MSSRDVYMFCKKCLLEIQSVKSLKIHLYECVGVLSSEHSSTVVPHLQIQKIKERVRDEVITENIKELISQLGEKTCKVDDSNKLSHPTPILGDSISENDLLKLPLRKKDKFTHIKNIKKTTEIEIEEKRQKVANIATLDQIPDKQTLLKNIELELLKLNPDNYHDILKNAMRYRQNLLCLIYPCEYTEIIKSYSIRINDYLSKTVKLNNPTIKREILKYFNTIETRLLGLDNFHKISPNYDDIVWYNQSLERSKLSVAEFLPYNKHKVFQRMLNYGVLTSPILSIVKRELLNSTDFNNFVYLDISRDSDKFSFYYLEGVDKKKRQWKLDCRLEEFTNDLIDNLLDYCCDMFRNFYNKIYGDNDYREKYWDKNEFFLYDQQQLLQNILLLLDKPKLMKLLQNLLSESACYTPSEIDTFNLRSDDKLQQKRLIEEGKVDKTAEIVYRVHELFNDLNCTTNPNLKEYVIRSLI